MLRRSDAPGEGRDAKMARALAVRVGLSVTLFLFVLKMSFQGSSVTLTTLVMKFSTS